MYSLTAGIQFGFFHQCYASMLVSGVETILPICVAITDVLNEREVLVREKDSALWEQVRERVAFDLLSGVMLASRELHDLFFRCSKEIRNHCNAWLIPIYLRDVQMRKNG